MVWPITRRCPALRTLHLTDPPAGSQRRGEVPSTGKMLPPLGFSQKALSPVLSSSPKICHFAGDKAVDRCQNRGQNFGVLARSRMKEAHHVWKNTHRTLGIAYGFDRRRRSA